MSELKPLRLFIGIPIASTESLVAAVKRTKISSSQKEMEIDWVLAENYHVTLNFLGNIERERVPLVESILQNAAQEAPAFSTSLKGLGAFPDELHMRTLWVGVRNSKSLRFLQGCLREALVEKGFHQEDRDYVPHLTIGKMRKSRSGRDLLSPYVRTKFGDVEVGEVVLFASQMRGSHIHYDPIFRVPLTGKPYENEEELA